MSRVRLPEIQRTKLPQELAASIETLVECLSAGCTTVVTLFLPNGSVHYICADGADSYRTQDDAGPFIAHSALVAALHRREGNLSPSSNLYAPEMRSHLERFKWSTRSFVDSEVLELCRCTVVSPCMSDKLYHVDDGRVVELSVPPLKQKDLLELKMYLNQRCPLRGRL